MKSTTAYEESENICRSREAICENPLCLEVVLFLKYVEARFLKFALLFFYIHEKLGSFLYSWKMWLPFSSSWKMGLSFLIHQKLGCLFKLALLSFLHSWKMFFSLCSWNMGYPFLNLPCFLFYIHEKRFFYFLNSWKRCCLIKLALLSANSISEEIPQRFGGFPRGEKIRSRGQIVFSFPFSLSARHFFFYLLIQFFPR